MMLAKLALLALLIVAGQAATVPQRQLGPSATKTERPTVVETEKPQKTEKPTVIKTEKPQKTEKPTIIKTEKPQKTEKPTVVKTEKPQKTEKPTVIKTEKPTVVKTEKPHKTEKPTSIETKKPSAPLVDACTPAGGVCRNDCATDAGCSAVCVALGRTYFNNPSQCDDIGGSGMPEKWCRSLGFADCCT
ncbi:hypothetical protein JKP88DRAFT_252611 [Tribonema minus]|uniref:Uncharacterized protein n=1 Tax=Tribonema minus TaxID=303371 RepID=A0A836CLP4_9STRA|nr:hypothetical protein JKP88DRAFT_252611 [Tribonema minus]